MRELHLFAGAGGGILGSMLLGHDIVGAVEVDSYCQQILAQRQKDGILPTFPIFGDIRTFLDSGSAKLYRGVAEIISAGFPCQPFSVAGKRKGHADERNLWPETIECIRQIRPAIAFLENVPGLLSSGYFGRILADLSQAGYDARWMVLGADQVGAPHKRARLWILAHSVGIRTREWSELERTGQSGESVEDSDLNGGHQATDNGFPVRSGDARVGQAELGDSECIRCEGNDRRNAGPQLEGGRAAAVADTSHDHGRTGECEAEAGTGADAIGWRRSESGSEVLADSEGGRFETGDQGCGNFSECVFEPRSSCGGQPWAHFGECEDARLAGSGIRRVSHGVSARVAKLRAAGNAQVPLVAATAFRILMEGLR